MDDITVSFAAIMAHLPMTQAELADRLKVNQSTVARWAVGATTPSRRMMTQAVTEVKRELKKRLSWIVRWEGLT